MPPEIKTYQFGTTTFTLNDVNQNGRYEADEITATEGGVEISREDAELAMKRWGLTSLTEAPLRRSALEPLDTQRLSLAGMVMSHPEVRINILINKLQNALCQTATSAQESALLCYK